MIDGVDFKIYSLEKLQFKIYSLIFMVYALVFKIQNLQLGSDIQFKLIVIHF